MRRRRVFEKGGALEKGDANGRQRQEDLFSEGRTFDRDRRLRQDVFAVAGGN
jgi:hypothetical protein